MTRLKTKPKAKSSSQSKAKTTKTKELKYNKKVDALSPHQHLVFVCCAKNGILKADKKTADFIEVIDKDTIHKCAIKLVKKGFFNVNDGIFTLSKMGEKQVIRK